MAKLHMSQVATRSIYTTLIDVIQVTHRVTPSITYTLVERGTVRLTAHEHTDNHNDILGQGSNPNPRSEDEHTKATALRTIDEVDEQFRSRSYL